MKRFIILIIYGVLCFLVLNEKSMFCSAYQYVLQGDTASAQNQLVKWLFPLYQYSEKSHHVGVETEDHVTYEMILSQQANDEDKVSEDLTTSKPAVTASVEVEQLKDYNYLLSKFYTVDSTTTISKEQLNVDEFLKKDLKINTETSGPKVLIFHTHSQEAFADSAKGNANDSIVGMGAYLAECLNSKGIAAIHHNGVYDLIGGKLDRSKAYELSETGVRKILKQYPSVEVVIDLHRDGVPDGMHLVTNINGKDCAKIMYFNGLSRTKTQGNIAYLPNPYIQDNLAFSFRMQLATETMYPNLARKIYLKGYRYSLHMMPKSLLIEAGAQTNTVQEMKNTMELLANVLAEVLL